ncbi:MAG: hypothetical protein ACK5L7_10745 [Paludibacteraceae bacterium]
MKTKLLLINAFLILFGVASNIFAASTPAANDGKWYYVKSQRGGTGLWWTFDTTNSWTTPGILNKNNNQKFALAQVGTSNVTMKEYGGLLLTAATTGVFDATGATTGWTQTSNMVNGVQGYAFPGENSGLHQWNAGTSWKVKSGYYSITDNSTFFFYEDALDLDLNIAIDDALVRKNTTNVGTGVGQTPQPAVDDYAAAIATAQTTLGSTDATAIQSAIDALANATTTFINAKVPIVQSSTSASPIWYLIKNTTRNGKGATFFAPSFGVQTKCGTPANTVKADGTSTGAAKPYLNHLFRFEKQTDGTYQIINAAFPSGEVLQGTSGGNSSAAVNYGTVTSPLTKWNINLIGYNSTLDVNEIKFVSAGNSTVWHCAGSYNVVSYEGNSGTASAWYVEEYTGDPSALTVMPVAYPFTGTIDANKSYTLKLVQSGSANDGYYLANPRTDTDNGNDGLRPYATFVPTIETSSTSSTAWKFVPSTTTGKYLITSIRMTNEHLDEEGRVRDASVYADNGWITKTLLQNTPTYTDGTTLLIVQIVQNSNYFISATTAGAVLRRDASTWSTFLMEPFVATSTSAMDNTPITVSVVNGTLVVKGTQAKANVYTLAGTQIDATKTLNTGIYIVKVDSKTFKINVK